jgi:hypothetical protein
MRVFVVRVKIFGFSNQKSVLFVGKVEIVVANNQE